jgi:hypothetical protein
MRDQNMNDKFAAAAVALLLILTAWGNAAVMAGVSAVGLLLSAIVYRKRIFRGPGLAATAGFILAVLLALGLKYIKK